MACHPGKLQLLDQAWLFRNMCPRYWRLAPVLEKLAQTSLLLSPDIPAVSDFTYCLLVKTFFLINVIR